MPRSVMPPMTPAGSIIVFDGHANGGSIGANGTDGYIHLTLI